MLSLGNLYHFYGMKEIILEKFVIFRIRLRFIGLSPFHSDYFLLNKYSKEEFVNKSFYSTSQRSNDLYHSIPKTSIKDSTKDKLFFNIRLKTRVNLIK